MTAAWLAEWRPPVERTVARIAKAPLKGLAALLDDGLAAPDWGDDLPPLWHFAGLPTWPDHSTIGADGHPERGTLLPPVPLARRMFAGSTLTLDRPVTVGATVTVERTVSNVETKVGRSGDLVVVTVTQTIRAVGRSAPAVVEHQQLIYRDASHEGDPAGTFTGGPDRASLRQVAPWHWHLATDPVLLFRFAAATANSHRIHYDLSYAREVEGYPALVVQGPLIAVSLAELLRLELPGGIVRAFSFRARQPMYSGETVCLRGRQEAAAGRQRVELVAGRCGDVAQPCMTAEATCG